MQDIWYSSTLQRNPLTNNTTWKPQNLSSFILALTQRIQLHFIKLTRLKISRVSWIRIGQSKQWKSKEKLRSLEFFRSFPSCPKPVPLRQRLKMSCVCNFPQLKWTTLCWFFLSTLKWNAESLTHGKNTFASTKLLRFYSFSLSNILFHLWLLCQSFLKYFDSLLSRLALDATDLYCYFQG